MNGGHYGQRAVPEEPLCLQWISSSLSSQACTCDKQPCPETVHAGYWGNRKLTLCRTENQLQLLNQSLIGHYSKQIGLIDPTSNHHYRLNLDCGGHHELDLRLSGSLKTLEKYRKSVDFSIVNVMHMVL